jgi:hypothetical protein
MKLNEMFHIIRRDAKDVVDREAKYAILRNILTFRSSIGISNNVIELHPANRSRIREYFPAMVDSDHQHINEIYEMLHCTALESMNTMNNMNVDEMSANAPEANAPEAEWVAANANPVEHENEQVVAKPTPNEAIIPNIVPHTTIVIKVNFDPIIYTLMFANCLMALYVTLKMSWSS